jgi:DNA-binding NarL/FixJ family response regulator
LFSVLIVDDSAMIRRCLRTAIEENQALYVCGEAENGKVAVEKVSELRPDTVILDLQMPVMNGLEAARQISNFAPDTVMLMYTMHCSDQLLRDAQAAGIQEVFSMTDGGPNHLLAWLSSACARR